MIKFLISLFIVFSSLAAVNDSKGDIEKTHDFLSSRIIGFAEYIDSFFGQYSRTDKKNRTRITLVSDTNLDEKGPLTSRFAVKARLNLPHLEELLKIKVKKEKRTEVNKVEKSNDDSSVKDSPVEDKYYFIDRKFTTQVSLDVTTKPDVSINSDQRFEIGDYNDIGRFTNSVFWSGRGGLGDRVALEYDRLMTNKLLFRFINHGTWTEKTGRINFSHGPQFFYSINDSSSLSFDIRMDGEKRDHSLWAIVGYTSSVVYSIRPFYNWILFRTGPVLTYPQEFDFASKLSYFLQIQVVVGGF